jgi:transcriptional regulator with GAF, ATPase, and Fis domain
MADTGTLFLDEIGDIPVALQPKLLRVLQEQEFERLGSGKTHQVNVRLVAATHRDLSEMIARKQFRSDLYYRLNVFPVALPPLRERREDIALLVSHFVRVFSQRMGKRIREISSDTLDAFTSYCWPGNVRELQNLVERALIGSDQEVLANPFPESDSKSLCSNPVNTEYIVPSFAYPGTFRESERAQIRKALHASHWIIGGPRGAAARLGLKRTTLISKMKKLGISRPLWQTDPNMLNPNFETEHAWQPAAH